MRNPSDPGKKNMLFLIFFIFLFFTLFFHNYPGDAFLFFILTFCFLDSVFWILFLGFCFWDFVFGILFLGFWFGILVWDSGLGLLWPQKLDFSYVKSFMGDFFWGPRGFDFTYVKSWIGDLSFLLRRVLLCGYWGFGGTKLDIFVWDIGVLLLYLLFGFVFIWLFVVIFFET